MTRPTTLAALALALSGALTLGGCPVLGTRATEGGRPDGPILSAPDPAVVREPGTFNSATGCLIHTVMYRPSRPKTDGLTVLAPGFMRDQSHLSDLAQAIAARGIPTMTLTPCNSRPWGGRHVQTGADMRRLARSQGARRIVYGGFSAGALSALVAARLDPHSVGVLALDLVDERRLGIGMARQLDRPLIGLRGEPGRCNAENNGLPVFAAAPRAQLTPIPGASHCDFESPSDWLCETLCAADASGPQRRRREVIERSVASVADLLALAPDAVH
jgi:dienelactone hydrolase